mmetsp:Transcript_12203/g.28622  ORF Transcript_12203/g.28622 Transcript_12203/m.28622 type:complete len:611 (+) Transcript_12203:216-2048(+)
MFCRFFFCLLVAALTGSLDLVGEVVGGRVHEEPGVRVEQVLRNQRPELPGHPTRVHRRLVDELEAPHLAPVLQVGREGPEGRAQKVPPVHGQRHVPLRPWDPQRAQPRLEGLPGRARSCPKSARAFRSGAAGEAVVVSARAAPPPLAFVVVTASVAHEDPVPARPRAVVHRHGVAVARAGGRRRPSSSAAAAAAGAGEEVGHPDGEDGAGGGPGGHVELSGEAKSPRSRALPGRVDPEPRPRAHPRRDLHPHRSRRRQLTVLSLRLVGRGGRDGGHADLEGAAPLGVLGDLHLDGLRPARDLHRDHLPRRHVGRDLKADAYGGRGRLCTRAAAARGDHFEARAVDLEAVPAAAAHRVKKDEGREAGRGAAHGPPGAARALRAIGGPAPPVRSRDGSRAKVAAAVTPPAAVPPQAHRGALVVALRARRRGGEELQRNGKARGLGGVRGGVLPRQRAQPRPLPAPSQPKQLPRHPDGALAVPPPLVAPGAHVEGRRGQAPEGRGAVPAKLRVRGLVRPHVGETQAATKEASGDALGRSGSTPPALEFGGGGGGVGRVDLIPGDEAVAPEHPDEGRRHGRRGGRLGLGGRQVCGPLCWCWRGAAGGVCGWGVC